MLAEMYAHLKEEYPSHGLEIIFCSSDRDPGSFQEYFGKMPWLALPFEKTGTFGRGLSMKYGVRGIPALIILDSMSGEVIVNASSSRGEVTNACNRGDAGIESLFQSWLDRVPSESRELLTSLEFSCIADTEQEETTHPYLLRSSSEESAKEDTKSLIKTKFAELVAQGMSPNEAAAKAITMVTNRESLAAGPLNETFETTSDVASSTESCAKTMLATENGRAQVNAVLDVALKYLEKARESPWTAKYRTFKLSNKFADGVSRIDMGLELIRSLGFQVIATSQDFCGNIPVGADLDAMHAKAKQLRE
jgi:hypothetical protein